MADGVIETFFLLFFLWLCLLFVGLIKFYVAKVIQNRILCKKNEIYFRLNISFCCKKGIFTSIL